MNIYYAHCIAIYDTPQEERDINLLESLGFTVINPNQPEHQLMCKGMGMEYFLQLTARCDALAFRAIPGIGVPAGVAKEITLAHERGMPVIELPSLLGRSMSIDDTREYLKECGKR